MLWATGSFDPADNHYGSHLYQLYVPWREVETLDQQFDWDGFESNHLDPILAADPQATFVLRPVADYPDGPGSGLDRFYGGSDIDRDFPEFLLQNPFNIGSQRYSSCDGDGPGVTPDWNDTAMRLQMQQFVDALGERYDGDYRITAIQFGLLGLWGEWHQSGCDAWGPSDSTKALIRDRYAQAFQVTPLQTRYARVADTGDMEVGFHEDYFPSYTTWCVYDFDECDDTGDWNMEWNFSHSNPQASDNWSYAPISGESPLTSQQEAWIADQADVLRVLEDYRFSFLGPAGMHETPDIEDDLVPIKQALGYRFRLRSATWPDRIVQGFKHDLHLEILNDGSAPLYHAFPVELQLFDHQGTLHWRQTLDVDLKGQLPAGEPTPYQPAFHIDGASTGEYQLRLVITRPDSSNLVGIRFQSRGQDAIGRLILGNVEVVAPECSGTDLVLEANDFPAGATLLCTATRSITLLSGVRVTGNAEVQLIAPEIRTLGAFAVERGSRFNATTLPDAGGH